jgi:MFS family permease
MSAATAPDGRLRALLAGFATPVLRSMQSASALSSIGEWGFMVILSIYAFDQGGATAVGLAGGLRLVPAAIAAPLASGLVDRRSRRAVIVRCLVLRAISLGALAALVAAHGPLAVVLVLAGVFSVVSTVFRPATAALLPLIARTPQQLAAANAIGSALANGGFLVGALAGGVISAVASPAVAFALAAATFLLAAVVAVRLPHDAPPASAPAEGDVLRETTAGVRALVASHESRIVVALFGAATIVEGASDVLIVVLALDLLDLGQAGVGWLNAAWGVGGLVGGAVAAAALVGGRLALGLSGGSVLAGSMLAGIGLWPTVGAALIMLGVLGVGYAFVEVAETTLLQRLLPDEILGRAFGAVESVYLGATGLGALIAPLVIAALGARGAFAALGLVLTLLALIAWPSLGRFAAAVPVGEREFALLRGVPFLGLLPLATLETLARHAERVPIGAGDVVIREGDVGDRFYILDAGEISISQDSEPLRTDGPGGFFGEIALLRDVPRTATVVATRPGALLALDREAFLTAVTGQDRSAETAHAVATARLADDTLAAEDA